MGYSDTDKHKIKLPLHLVLIIPFVIIILVTVVLTDYIALKNGQAAVDDLVERLSAEIDSDVKNHLDVFLDEPFKINQINLNALQQGRLNSSDTEEMARYFWQQGQIFTGLEAMGYGNDMGELAGANVHEKHMIITSPSQNGMVLRRYAVGDDGRRTDTILSEIQDFDVHTREWYQAAVKARRPVWTQINPSLTLLRLDLSAVTPYYDQEGRLQGVFYLDLSLSQLNRFLSDINISSRGKMIIMERNGLMVASSTQEQPYIINGTHIKRLNVSASSEPMIVYGAKHLEAQFSDRNNIPAPYRSGFDINGERYYIHVSPYRDPRGLDWLVMIVIPESDFMAQINAGNKNTTMLIMASLFLSIVVAILVSRRITQPLSSLSLSARALARGDYDQKLKIDRSDEVGELANAFNSMAARLKENMIMLKMSEAKFRSLFEQSPIPIEVYDAQGRLVDANSACLELFGITELKYVLGFELFGDPNIPADAKEHLAKGETVSFESVFDFDLVREKNLYPTTRSGICHIDCVIHPLLDMNNEFSGYIVHVRDITERKLKEEELRASLEEKTVLLNEVHHRVKNNLQIVSSLISLQAMRTKNKEALDTLRETGNRVYTMALLHETIYRSGNMAKVSFSRYIENICYHITHSYGVEPSHIKLEQHLADISLDLDQAVPCGLIITELVSNALKHAFPKGQKGRITVELQELPDDLILLKVADDGIGLPPWLDISKSETLGLKLVSMLTEKLKGSVEIIRGKGTTFIITFKTKND